MDFEVKDIRADPAAYDELGRLGARATPTIVVDGEVVVGFDAERLRRLLGRRG